MHAWEASIDRQLVARLERPIVRPGVIDMALVRRILAGVTAMTARLSLLARFGGRRELAATTPIVHARWTAPAPVETTAALPSTRPIVHAAPSRATDRSAPASAPASTVVSGLASGPASGSAPTAPRERPAHPIAPNHAITAAMTDARPEASPASSHELAGGADPVVRRSRVGAPLPARPRIARPIGDQVPEPARPLIAPSAPAAASSPGGTYGRSSEPPAGELRARAAIANPMARVRPRAAAAGPPAMIANTAAPARTPVVAPATARQAPLPIPAIRPVIAPARRPERPPVEHLPVPVVPARSGDGARARAIELPLAHPAPAATPAAAPAAIAALSSAATPRPIAAPRLIPEAAPPPAPPAPKIDLPRLAEQVQRILVRQTAHARARQGLPR
jgi:hypothetical protein